MPLQLQQIYRKFPLGCTGHRPMRPIAWLKPAAYHKPASHRPTARPDTLLPASAHIYGRREIGQQSRFIGLLIEHRLRIFQVGGVEALGEPAVDRGEQIARFHPSALLAPQPAEARRRAQLP